MKISLKSLFLALTISAVFFSCSSDDNDSTGDGIPSDSDATENPFVTNSNANIPNALFAQDEGSDNVININMTGIQNPETKEWLDLQGTNMSEQNVWVEVDGQPKGIVVYNNAADNAKSSGKKVYADLIFLVDNSGSMTQESDSVANGIVNWAMSLENGGLNIQFGCVGYMRGVNGALDLGSVKDIFAYLNRDGKKANARTKGYDGYNALKLELAGANYLHGRDECGSEALRYADENFTFRDGANRIYVNFTDEPNQPGGKKEWGVEYVADQQTWNTSKGTIHTVYSADTTFTEVKYSKEKPWRMSRYTGGTELYAPSNFKNVTLDLLPVTGAMVNSYIIKFKNTSEIANGTHEVKITVLSKDEKVRSVKVFKNVQFGK